MVAAAIAVGLFIAVTVTPPTEVPTVALRAEAVYRVEVGGAVFLGLYIATIALGARPPQPRVHRVRGRRCQSARSCSALSGGDLS
jgi:hypothetical protein